MPERPMPRMAWSLDDWTLGAVLRSGWLWTAIWVLSRAWLLHLYHHNDWIKGDVVYYSQWVNQGVGIESVLREYPVPVVWLLDAINLLATDTASYVVVFGMAMALLDAWFTWFLWKFSGRPATVAWIAFTFSLGPLIWMRLDMVSAVVVGVAVVMLRRRPALSGGLVAVGAAIKLWPALLILPLLGRDQRAKRRLIAFAVTGVVLAVGAFLGAGWTRLISPLRWQSARGLQIESLAATWPMFERGWRQLPGWPIEFSSFNAYELQGPGVAAWQRIAAVAMIGVVVAALMMGLLSLLAVRHRVSIMTLAVVAITAAMLAANKTLSPQYYLWLAAPVAALVGDHMAAHDPDGQPSRRGRRRALVIAGITLVIGVLTQRVFPIGYMDLITNPVGGRRPTLELVVRNLLVAALALLTIFWSFAELLDAARSRKDPVIKAR